MIEVLPTRSVRALVVDGHDATRVGFAVLLRQVPWVASCLLARDGSEAATLAARQRPDVALLDISDAGPFVAAATAQLHAARPSLPIVLTSRCAARPPAEPQRLGAVSFVSVGAPAAEIVAAVRTALTADVAPAPSPPSPELSERDRRLLALISQGATNREIAAELAMSPDAIKKNASALYRKLGVRNRTEAARRAPELLTSR